MAPRRLTSTVTASPVHALSVTMPGFSANFTPGPAYVPVPAAVWLFGSGLLGLIGVARRKKNS